MAGMNPVLRAALLTIAATTVVTLLFVATYWFNYSRTASFEMRWETGEEVSFNTYGPNFMPNGDPKILVLLPSDNRQCYFISYSRDLLAYLRKENKPTVPVSLELHYSYGRIYSFSILKFGNYHLRNELSQMAHTGAGDCVEHLDRYAQPPGLGQRH
jgi:hypothetical protein